MLTSVISSLVIAVVTAMVTVWLALRRFYSEQWWSRKAQAYVEILSALFKVKAYLHARLTQCMSPTALTHEEETKLLERARDGYDEVLRASAVNVLFLTESAQSCIESILPTIQNSWLPDDYGQLEPTTAAVEKCINELRDLAKRDLRRL